jgi:predicted ester cyclase
MGLPPTGKQIALEIIDILRLANGKVVEHWAVRDQMGMMQQLGLVPTSDQS